MKNIHLLPTDQPSNLHFDSELFFTTNIQLSKEINSIVEGRNIYITSDEEIKEGEKGWLLENNSITKNVCEFDCSNGLGGIYSTDKKIILTTDQDLIKDGVQSINDEFLEWFVKNPSCEFVPIITTIVSNESTTYKTNIGFESWRKEEPKQEQKELRKKLFNVIDMIEQEESKQETLEEAAEKWVFETNGHKWSNNDNTAGDNYGSFKAGAKWQAERMYSEEEVVRLLIKFNQEIQEVEDVREWFEQFKKK